MNLKLIENLSDFQTHVGFKDKVGFFSNKGGNILWKLKRHQHVIASKVAEWVYPGDTSLNEVKFFSLKDNGDKTFSILNKDKVVGLKRIDSSDEFTEKVLDYSDGVSDTKFEIYINPDSESRGFYLKNKDANLWLIGPAKPEILFKRDKFDPSYCEKIYFLIK